MCIYVCKREHVSLYKGLQEVIQLLLRSHENDMLLIKVSSLTGPEQTSHLVPPIPHVSLFEVFVSIRRVTICHQQSIMN